MLGVVANTGYRVPKYILVLDTYNMIVSQNYSYQLSKIAASYINKNLLNHVGINTQTDSRHIAIISQNYS